MKRTILILPAAALLAAACSEKPAAEEKPAVERVPSTISIRAVSEHLWAAKDAISVFDVEGARVDFGTTSDNVPAATFSTSSWTGKAPVYAAFCSKKNDVTCTPDGVMGVFLKSSQGVTAKEKCPKDGEASVGKISGSPGSYEVNMLSISAFVRVNLKTGIVAKVNASAVGGEVMTGYVDVDYSKISAGDADFWTPTDSKSTLQNASIVPAAGGCFSSGVYLISILPGKYAQGIKLTVFDDEGKSLSTTVLGETDGIVLGRGEEVSATVEIDGDFEIPGTGFEPVSFGDTVNYDDKK